MKRICHYSRGHIGYDTTYSVITMSRYNLLPKLSYRSILTEADSGEKETKRIPEEEKESWPTHRGFTMANYAKMQRDSEIKSSFMEFLEMKSQKTRSYFDRIFELITGQRIDGAGNWLVTFSLCICSCIALIYYRRYNDKLRLQCDDLLTYRDQLQVDIANMKQRIDDINNEEGIQ
eukprot:176956_1